MAFLGKCHGKLVSRSSSAQEKQTVNENTARI
jgi:hypothetical protein